jgi:hypothetical protein
VKSLAAFPSVMDMMGRQPQWVESVGDAFLAQPDDVMDSVQRLRVQAQKAGTLKSNEQQKVVTQQSGGTTIVQIEPASPQVVYVPSYNPTVVYGAWPYPAYPPAYYPPPPGSVFATSLVAGIGFGLGVAAVNSMWGGFNWGSHDVNINVNRYNNINVNQRLDVNRSNVNWQHNPRTVATCRTGIRTLRTGSTRSVSRGWPIARRVVSSAWARQVVVCRTSSAWVRAEAVCRTSVTRSVSVRPSRSRAYRPVDSRTFGAERESPGWRAESAAGWRGSSTCRSGRCAQPCA